MSVQVNDGLDLFQLVRIRLDLDVQQAGEGAAGPAHGVNRMPVCTGGHRAGGKHFADQAAEPLLGFCDFRLNFRGKLHFFRDRLLFFRLFHQGFHKQLPEAFFFRFLLDFDFRFLRKALEQPGQSCEIPGLEPFLQIVYNLPETSRIDIHHSENPVAVLEHFIVGKVQLQHGLLCPDRFRLGTVTKACGAERFLHGLLIPGQTCPFQHPGKQLAELRIIRTRHQGTVHCEPVGARFLQRHAAVRAQTVRQIVEQGGVDVHSAMVIDICGHQHIGLIVHVPAVCGLAVLVGIAHAADPHLAVLAHRPCLVLRGLHQHLAQISLNVAERFIDGPVIVHVGIVGHDRVCHAMGKLVGTHIQALGQVIDGTGQEALPAVELAGIRGIVDGIVILVAEVLQDHDGRALTVRTLPADFLVIVIDTAVVIQGLESDLIPFQVILAVLHLHLAAVIQEFPAVRHHNPVLNIPEIVHAGAGITHQRDADLLLRTVRPVYIPGILHRLHELEGIARVISGIARHIARQKGGQAVEVFPAHGHVMRQVRKIVVPARRRIVRVHSPYKAGIVFLRFHVQNAVHRQHHPPGHALDPVYIHMADLLFMPDHQQFRLLPGQSLRGLRFRKVRGHAAGKPGHAAFGIRHHLHRAAQHDGIRIGLLEDIVHIPERIFQFLPGLEMRIPVPAQQLTHGFHHGRRIIHVLYRFIRACAFHKGDMPVLHMNPGRAAAEHLNVLQRQLTVSGTAFCRLRPCGGKQHHDHQKNSHQSFQ